MIRYCQVKNCRFKYSHTTKGHKCGKCKEYGHGFIECGDELLVSILKYFQSDTMPNSEKCTAQTCNYRDTHSIEAHVCLKCGGRHSVDTCSLYSKMPLSAIDDARKIMVDTPGKIYVKLWTGMGTWSFYKRDDVGKLVDNLMVDHDKEKSLQVSDFINGYTLINK